ncbi:hypothetical protein GCM10023158_19840 [Gluconacetobacter tumulicola]
MLAGLGKRKSFRSDAEVATNSLGDIAKGQAFFRDGVVAGATLALFEHEAEEVRSIKPVHRRPAILTVFDIGR